MNYDPKRVENKVALTVKVGEKSISCGGRTSWIKPSAKPSKYLACPLLRLAWSRRQLSCSARSYCRRSSAFALPAGAGCRFFRQAMFVYRAMRRPRRSSPGIGCLYRPARRGGGGARGAGAAVKPTGSSLSAIVVLAILVGGLVTPPWPILG